MRELNQTYNWEGKSSDPNDEQFGHVVEPVTLETADSYGAVLVGEPYDGAVIGRPGAREGPSAIRDQLAGTKTHHIDAGPVRSVGDLGDIRIPAGESVSGVQESVRETTKKIHGLDTLPVFMGGDNSLTYPNVAPLLDTYDAVGAISFDAHFDCREVFEHPSSGTPYRQLHEDGLDAFAVVGARHFENSTEYADYVSEQEGEIVTAEEVSEDVVSAIDYALEAMEGIDAVYVSVDMDVLDASVGPGVSAPTPGGISTLDLYRGVRMVAADDRVVGFEVVECSPPLDFRDMTSKAAARGVAQFLGGAKASGKI